VGTCDYCGRRAAVHPVVYRQNIGLVVLWWRRSVRGALCAPCRRRQFWTLTGVTAVLGWWGIVSFFVTAVTLVLNVGQHAAATVGSRGRPPPAATPGCPRCGDERAEKVGLPVALQIATVFALGFCAAGIALALRGNALGALPGALGLFALTAVGVVLANPSVRCSACGNRRPRT
jgi:hypothetical protein